MTDRRYISTGSSFERDAAYSRAVVDGEWVFVAGTTGFDYATGTIAPDVAAQAEQTLRTVEHVLEHAGATLADVVRATYYITDRRDFAAIAPVLRARFGAHPPAATCIVCALIDERMKIEIEVTARRRLPS